ncbi:unnamed protein product [Meloidogyne enterolobii]|uniref:Uncharacterized protein n=1 Tax=Meloidogyne enterolobii TaxID=390850 RepID=A0ACB1A758_MELEN
MRPDILPLLNSITILFNVNLLTLNVVFCSGNPGVIIDICVPSFPSFFVPLFSLDPVSLNFY